MKVFIKIFVCLFIILKKIYCTDFEEDGVHERHRRQLLFPNTTLLQFNAGVGTPSLVEHINVNWAFQANFMLPWNRTQIPVDILNANTGYTGQSKRDVGDYENDAKLMHFYMYVEDVLDGFGHDGRSCVQKTLCQIGAEPLHSDDEEDLLHELAVFVLNPMHDANEGFTEKDDQYPYIEAYKRGQELEDCSQIYKNCKISLVDMFSQVYGN